MDWLTLHGDERWAGATLIEMMGLRRNGLKMTDDEFRKRVHSWVERTTREQGVPLKVTDPVVLNRVAEILSQGRQDRLR